MINKLSGYFPGIILVTIISFISKELGNVYPLVGSVVIAIFIGALIRNGFSLNEVYLKGVNFTLKRVLKVAIIILGVSLSFKEVTQIGYNAIIVVLGVVIFGILLTKLIGKLLKIDDELGLLIGIGTSICGATAITASKEVIKAKEIHTAYAISTIFLFNLIATILYPWIGHIFNMPETMFGIWDGTAVHDTSSVVAIGYMYGNESGEIATTVKLVRTMFLLPLILIISVWQTNKEIKNKKSKIAELKKIFPWFILGFLGMSLLNSFGFFNEGIKSSLVDIAKYLILMVMASVGLQVEIKKFLKLGAKPLITGLIASVFVSALSISLISILNLY